MDNMLHTTLTIYKNYGGGSMMTMIVAAAVLYLWIAEERKEIRLLFVHLATGVVALFFFPLFAYIATHFFLDEQV